MATLALDVRSPQRATKEKNDQEINKPQDISRETSLECYLILGAGNNRFWNMVEDMENAYTQGQDRYHKTTI